MCKNTGRFCRNRFNIYHDKIIPAVSDYKNRNVYGGFYV